MKKIALSNVVLRYRAALMAGESILDVVRNMDIPCIQLAQEVEVTSDSVWVYPEAYKNRWWTDKGTIFPKEIVLIIHDGKPYVVVESFHQDGHRNDGDSLTIAPFEIFDLTA